MHIRRRIPGFRRVQHVSSCSHFTCDLVEASFNRKDGADFQVVFSFQKSAAAAGGRTQEHFAEEADDELAGSGGEIQQVEMGEESGERHLFVSHA